jgi:hypothetical protein
MKSTRDDHWFLKDIYVRIKNTTILEIQLSHVRHT